MYKQITNKNIFLVLVWQKQIETRKSTLFVHSLLQITEYKTNIQIPYFLLNWKLKKYLQISLFRK